MRRSRTCGTAASSVDASGRSGLCVIAQEFNQQLTHLLRLFLLHPMSGAIDKVESHHMCAGSGAHLVDSARRLIDAPIAFPRDVLRGYVDGTARKGVHLG